MNALGENRPVDDPPGSFSATVPPATVKEVSRQAKRVQRGTKRREYSKVAPLDEKLRTVKYASINEAARAVRHYEEKETSIGHHVWLTMEKNS